MINKKHDLNKKLTEEKKAQNRVYVVESFGGQYDDKWEHIIGVYTDYDKALSVAKEECEKYFVDESKLPMTWDEYQQFNYGCPDCPDDGYDYNDESLCDYYNTCIDRDGHTKEEFELMNLMRSIEYNDFVGCNIESYVLNVSCDDKDKMRVFVSKCEDGTYIMQ